MLNLNFNHVYLKTMLVQTFYCCAYRRPNDYISLESLFHMQEPLRFLFCCFVCMWTIPTHMYTKSMYNCILKMFFY